MSSGFIISKGRRDHTNHVIGGHPIRRSQPTAENKIPVAPPQPASLSQATENSRDDQNNPALTETAAAQAKKVGYEEGYEAGHRQGYQDGYEKGLAAARVEIAQEREQARSDIEALVAALTQPLLRLKDDLAGHVTEGALKLAEAIVDIHIDSDESALRSTVAAILAEANETAQANDQLSIRVCPGAKGRIQHDLIKSSAVMAVAVESDPSLAEGDVVASLSTTGEDQDYQIEWDARMENRWDAIRSALKASRH